MTNQERMIQRLQSGTYNGFKFEPSGGHGYYMATKRTPTGTIREAVHVAADGTLRYSDSERFGEIWSLGTTGGMEPNTRWSGAYKDALPDSHFFYVDRACVRRTDSDGRSHPLSCRHFPYKDQQGNISLSHVRNAISRAPQSHLPAHVQRDVQRKARALLQHQDRMAANSPIVDDRLYTVTWVDGRRPHLTKGEAIDFVNRLRQEARSSGRSAPLRIQVFYRDGTPVPFADLERSMRKNTQQRFPGFGAPLEVTIPQMPRYKQISGDMDPGKYGGLVARSDGDNALELFEIQPVRELVGDDEAAEVGFPFWSKEAYYDLDDLRFDRDEVQHALQSVGLEEHELEAMTPDQRALAIAEALFRYGDKVEEAASGWSNDVVTEEVEWMRGDVAGADYIADEDDEFRREILGEDGDFEENPHDDGPCVIFCDGAGRGYYTGSVRMVPSYSPQAMEAKVFADKTAAARVITSHGSMGGCHIYLLKPDDPNYPDPVPPRTPFTENGEGLRRSRGISATTPNLTPGSALNSTLDESIYQLALEGTADDDIVGAGGKRGLIFRDGFDLANQLHAENLVDMDSIRWLEMKGPVGVIIVVDNNEAQVVYYDSQSELRADWSELETKLAGFEPNASSADRRRFEQIRERYIQAEEAYQEAEIKLGARWGHARNWKTYLKAADRKRLERLSAAKEREKDKFFELLQRISPRDWSYGVPSHWVVEKLPYEDAIRPANEPLSVEPPMAFGATASRT